MVFNFDGFLVSKSLRKGFGPISTLIDVNDIFFLSFFYCFFFLDDMFLFSYQIYGSVLMDFPLYEWNNFQTAFFYMSDMNLVVDLKHIMWQTSKNVCFSFFFLNHYTWLCSFTGAILLFKSFFWFSKLFSMELVTYLNRRRGRWEDFRGDVLRKIHIFAYFVLPFDS